MTIFGGLTAEALASRFRRLGICQRSLEPGRILHPHQRGRAVTRSDSLPIVLDGMAEELQELVQERRELAIAQERSRLARDLHDSAKQLALAASFKIATARTIIRT